MTQSSLSPKTAAYQTFQFAVRTILRNENDLMRSRHASLGTTLLRRCERDGNGEVDFEGTAPLSSGRWQPSLTTLNCRARHCGQAAQRSSRPARVRSRAAFYEAEN